MINDIHENKTSFSSGITLRGVLPNLTIHDLDSFVPFKMRHVSTLKVQRWQEGLFVDCSAMAESEYYN